MVDAIAKEVQRRLEIRQKYGKEGLAAANKLERAQVNASKVQARERTKAANKGKASLLKRSSFASERGIRRFRGATSGVGQLLTALGANTKGTLQREQASFQNIRRYAHAGRPSGSYKYGMPIQQFKKLQAQRKALSRLEALKEQERLAKSGYTPEQIQQVRLQQLAKEQVEQSQQSQQSNQASSQLEIIEEYKKQLEMQSVTPQTQAILDRIKWIQQKGPRDNANMQRVIRERKMVSQATELLKTPSLFGPESNTFNIFDETFNPLKAENIFAKRDDMPSLLNTGRPNIVQTERTGHRLKFF